MKIEAIRKVTFTSNDLEWEIEVDNDGDTTIRCISAVFGPAISGIKIDDLDKALCVLIELDPRQVPGDML